MSGPRCCPRSWTAMVLGAAAASTLLSLGSVSATSNPDGQGAEDTAPTPTHPATQDPVDLGPVEVVDFGDPSQPLAGGDWETPFTLLLPDRATCPGDSANDSWRVQTFLLPIDVDPPSVWYGQLGPIEDADSPHFVGEGQVWWALYDTVGQAYTSETLRPNLEPGQPGFIDRLPTFNLVLPAAAGLPAGRYRMGVACTFWRETANYWSTDIEVSYDGEVVPESFRWSVTDPSDGAVDAADVVRGDTSGSRLAGIGLIVGSAIVLAASAYFLVRRRTDTPTPPPTELEHST